MFRGSGSRPLSPAQGRSRSAKRTSSGAGTSAASPLCGDATRTTTARTTATRMTAVSGRPGREGKVGDSLLSVHVAAAATGPPPWTFTAGTCSREPLPSRHLGTQRVLGRQVLMEPGAKPGAARPREEGTPRPGCWAGTVGRRRDGPCKRLAFCDQALRDSCLGPTERARVSKFQATLGLASLLFLLGFVNEWAPRGP